MECTFCGREISRGLGKWYVKKDGTVYRFCSTKCQKNLLQNRRKPLRTKWTEAHHKQKELMKK